jgi:hypothetical protein
MIPRALIFAAILVVTTGCARLGNNDDAGNDAYVPPGNDAGSSGHDAYVAPNDAYVAPGTDAGMVDAYVAPGTDAGTPDAGGGDAGPVTYTVVGSIGSVGSVPAAGATYSVVDDGFETGGMVCSTGTPVYCVVGGIIP